MLTNREETFLSIRKKLLKAQAQMKHYADAKRRNMEYHPGDWVMLKLRPHRQSSAKHSQATSGKLSKRYYGPFQILQRVGQVAYKLQLPEGARIHPIFHCSVLKPFKGSPETMEPVTLPSRFDQNQPIIAPLTILDYRQRTDKKWEVLVQWEGLSPDETTWEELDQLRRDYHLEDKVFLQGPWNDMNSGREVQEVTQGLDSNEGVQGGKPKRTIHRPAYLKDYA